MKISGNVISALWMHEIETGEPLPMPAEKIAYLESIGLIVDLTTGEVTPDPDAKDTLEPLQAKVS